MLGFKQAETFVKSPSLTHFFVRCLCSLGCCSKVCLHFLCSYHFELHSNLGFCKGLWPSKRPSEKILNETFQTAFTMVCILQAVIHFKFQRMRCHADAAHVFFFEGDVAFDPVFTEHAAAG